MKKLMLLCLVAVGTMCLSFTAFAPAVQDSVSGHVYDQSDNSAIGGIVVEEIVNNVSVSSTLTEGDGSFSIKVKSQKPTLRFSDPDYQSYSTQEQTFNLSQDCSDVSVYMRSQSQEWRTLSEILTVNLEV